MRLIAAAVAGALSLGAAPAHPAPAVATYHASVDQSSGLTAQGVPPGLGRTGTEHASLRTHGRRAGAIELELLVTSTTYPSTVLLLGAVQLGRGTLAVQGVRAEDDRDTRLAVTGGSGAHAGASGVLRIQDDGTVTLSLRQVR